MDGKQEVIRYLLETHVMFSNLAGQEKQALEPLFEVRHWDEGARLAKQADPMDGLYFIYDGTVRIKRHHGGFRESLGTLGKESTFGEMSLLKESVWPNDMVAEEKVTVLVLPADKVRALAAQRQGMTDTFKKQVGLIELSQRLRGMLGSCEYRPDVFNEILAGIGVKKIRTGRNVFKQGDDDPRLYYLEQGAVELVRKTMDGGDLVIDKVVRGKLIGGSGALPDFGEGGIQPFTARAVNETVVLVFPQEQVKKILAINPQLHEDLRLRAVYLNSRESEELEVRKRAEGVDLRIKFAEGVTETEYRKNQKEAKSSREVRDFPLLRQRQASDAAAACLTMIMNYYKKDFSIGQVLELTNLGIENPDPNQVIGGAEKMGFGGKPHALAYEQLDDIKMPAIIGWESFHYAVLFRVTAKEVFLADPARKKVVKLKKAEFLEGWTRAPGSTEEKVRGVVIALNPTQKFEELEPPKNAYWHFIRLLLPYKGNFGLAMLAAVTINILGLASPLFIQTIVDTVVVHHDVSLLNMMLGGMVMVALFKTLTMVTQSMLLAHTTARIDLRMMAEFYRHILSLPISFFLTRNKGEILARFGENQKIRAIIAGSTITVILNVLMVFLYFGMMSAYNGTLTGIVMFFMPMYIGITLYFTPRLKAIAQQIFITGAQQQSHLIESLNGIEAIKATANEYFARARWENSFVENVNRSFQSQKLALMSNSLNQLVGLSTTVAILWYGANEVMNGNMSIGELMGFNMLMGLVVGPILSMVGLWNNMQEVRISVERVSDVLNVNPEQELVVSPDKIPATLEGCRGKIEFKNCSFSYVTSAQKEHFVMRDFNLTVEAGTRIAFVGASGCGKSTIAKMILGFNLPQSGQCLIDGKDITSLDLKSLRHNIGVVLQDSFIISGTVSENVAIGDPEPDLAAVKEATRLAGADEFIVNYPLGYQTQIGEKGMGISGGQRQRICIARALYRKPTIMIFDEATSALDNEAEKRIQENMDTLLAGKTSFTIAHRLSTIVDSDFICYIGDGQVMEKGTHEQLIDQEFLKANSYTGKYYSLAQGQFDLPPLKLD